jgi:hypothetical protein
MSVLLIHMSSAFAAPVARTLRVRNASNAVADIIMVVSDDSLVYLSAMAQKLERTTLRRRTVVKVMWRWFDAAPSRRPAGWRGMSKCFQVSRWQWLNAQLKAKARPRCPSRIMRASVTSKCSLPCVDRCELVTGLLIAADFDANAPDDTR